MKTTDKFRAIRITSWNLHNLLLFTKDHWYLLIARQQNNKRTCFSQMPKNVPPLSHASKRFRLRKTVLKLLWHLRSSETYLKSILEHSKKLHRLICKTFAKKFSKMLARSMWLLLSLFRTIDTRKVILTWDPKSSLHLAKRIFDALVK